MKETVVLIVSSGALVVLGYGTRLLQETVREYLSEKSSRADYIDWSKVPEGYDWVAVEDMPITGLHTFAYRMEPLLRMGNHYVSFQGGWDFVLVDSATVDPLPPWRESLRRRPGSAR